MYMEIIPHKPIVYLKNCIIPSSNVEIFVPRYRQKNLSQWSKSNSSSNRLAQLVEKTILRQKNPMTSVVMVTIEHQVIKCSQLAWP